MAASCDVTTTNELKCINYGQVISFKKWDGQVISFKKWEPHRGEYLSLCVTTGQSSARPRPTVPHVQQPYSNGGARTPHGTTSASLGSDRAIAHSDHSATRSHNFKLSILSLLTPRGRGFHSNTIHYII